MSGEIDGLDPGFDQRIADWLERDPRHAPSPVLDAVMAALPSAAQRRRSTVSRSAKVGAGRWPVAAAIVVASLLGGLVLTRSSTPSSIGDQAAAVVLHPIVSSTWSADDRVVLTIRRDPLIEEPLYWRVATYDSIRPNGWEQSDPSVVTRPAQSALLEGTFDDPGAPLTLRTGRFTVIPAAPADSLLVSPSTPVSASEAVRLTLIGESGFFGAARREAGRMTGYEITAQMPVLGDGTGELNAAALRAAGHRYPTAITERYLDVAEGIIGPNASALQRKIEGEARSRAPIDLVEATMAELRSGEYVYDTDLSDAPCAALSTVECLATYRKGFCQYYATTMAALLRRMGVPARIAEGFLPGDRTGTTEIIRATDAHAWVEVYFPLYGWVTFDPTPRPNPKRLPAPLPA